MLFLAELSKKRQSLIEYITICNGIKFWEETLSDNHRNSKNPLTLWELPLALTTSSYFTKDLGSYIQPKLKIGISSTSVINSVSFTLVVLVSTHNFSHS